MTGEQRRSGGETKAEAQRIALALFTSQGYEATSLRQIAEELNISKASLYYHFPSKEAIVTSVLADRGTEANDLLGWARAQPQGPDLLESIVLRWVESLSVAKLRGIRFANANPSLMRTISTDAGKGIRDGLEPLLQLALPGADAETLLLARMAFLSINAAAAAAVSTTLSDEQVVAAARSAALAIVAGIGRR